MAGDAELKPTDQIFHVSARVVECAGQCSDPQVRLPLPRYVARQRSTTSPKKSSDVSAATAKPGQCAVFALDASQK